MEEEAGYCLNPQGPPPMIDDKDGSERSGAAGALDAISDLEGGLRRWACAARAQGTAGGNDPADCNWPVCGCDPAADRVIAALQESGAIPDGGLTAAAHDVLAERRRQVEVEGWTIDHDDKHANGEMASAAACYVTAPLMSRIEREWVPPDQPKAWPWHWTWWKPSFRRRNLVKAAALLIAEIERIDRSEQAYIDEERRKTRATRNTPNA